MTEGLTCSHSYWYNCGNKQCHPKKISKSYLFRAYYSKGVSHHHINLADSNVNGKVTLKHIKGSGGKVALNMLWLEAVGLGNL